MKSTKPGFDKRQSAKPRTGKRGGAKPRNGKSRTAKPGKQFLCFTACHNQRCNPCFQYCGNCSFCKTENGESGETLSQQNQEPTNQERENVEAQNPDPTNPERENVAAQNLETENQEQQNPESGFPVLQFAITGGAVLVSGIAITVFAKRRKGKAAKP